VLAASVLALLRDSRGIKSLPMFRLPGKASRHLTSQRSSSRDATDDEAITMGLDQDAALR
jgi:hypothetical protein